MSFSTPALQVQGLTLATGADRDVELVTDVTFDLSAGEMVGLVGESGSGKSLTGSAIAGLLPRGVRQTSGVIEIDGHPVGGSKAGDDVNRRRSMIFQNPMTSLNPSMRIGDQVAEAIRLADPSLTRREARAEAVAMLARVEINRPDVRARQYPFEFSGGMRQRVMIAIAIASRPRILVADEPTTALDVTVQQGVMNLLDRLREELGLAVLLISHDLAVVSERCDRLLVMYAGELVETGEVRALLHDPRHPYVEGLLRCIPELALELGELHALPGRVPAAGRFAAACRFASRCPYHAEICDTGHPALLELEPGRQARCKRVGDLPSLSLGRELLTLTGDRDA